MRSSGGARTLRRPGGSGEDNGKAPRGPCASSLGGLRLTMVEFREARAFVERHHRTHRAPRRYKFAVGLGDIRVRLLGVAIVGRPVARALCDGETLEVTRCCTLGHANACSMLYGACARAAAALGARRLVTYTLASEGGSSLRASGFHEAARSRGGEWDRPKVGRPRNDRHPLGPKVRWERIV